MDRVILIKYGELTTKKKNRGFFVDSLFKSINNKLNGLNYTIKKDLSRMYIEFSNDDLELILNKINNIFGIHEYVLAFKVETNLKSIEDYSYEIMKNENFNSFKVETKRSDKSFPLTSQELSKKIGGVILRNIDNIKVDVHNPDITLHLEVRNDYTYIYTKSFYGLGGYPNSTLGHGMLMLSGGIDSPVAGFLALKRGVKLEAIYFESLPHTSLNARNKVINLCKKLSIYTNNIKLHVIPFTEIQEKIYETGREDYAITIMRRMMYRITDKLSKIRDSKVIINGESIGQVASQTLTSMSVINDVTNMPVIRPVACLDKLEIIDIAKKIDTYDISIIPFEDCCTIFVPKHPVINPELQICLELEKRFNYEEMIERAINNRITIKIDENYNNYSDLL